MSYAPVGLNRYFSDLHSGKLKMSASTVVNYERFDHSNQAIHSKEAQSYRDGLTKILKPQSCKLSFLDYYMKEFKLVLWMFSSISLEIKRNRHLMLWLVRYTCAIIQQPVSEDLRRLAELFAIEIDQDVLSAEIEVF
jgi:hypothetical protein